MDDFLTPLKTVITPKDYRPEQHLIEVSQVEPNSNLQYEAIRSPREALEALRSKPDLNLLTRVLRFLDPSKTDTVGFNIKIPGSTAAQLNFVLVTDIVPDYWALLATPSHAREQHLLLRCLKSVSGIGAILARLRFCLDAGNASKTEENLDAKIIPRILEDLLNVLEALLHKDNLVSTIWHDIATSNSKPSQRNLLWKEFVSVVGGGRILALAAEAHQILRQQGSEIKHASWLSSGSEYSSWLGRNVIHMLRDSKSEEPEDLKPSAQLSGKAFSIGYTGELENDIEEPFSNFAWFLKILLSVQCAQL
jgi:telomere length regulation protein